MVSIHCCVFDATGLDLVLVKNLSLCMKCEVCLNIGVRPTVVCSSYTRYAFVGA